MRLMALDIGERRIGVAVSESGFFAAPHSVIYRKSRREDFARIRRLVEDLRIDRLIIGLPYSLSGPDPIGPQARWIMHYADALCAELSIPCEYFDESYSTADAEAFLAQSGGKKTPIDAAAAAVILQNYLDAKMQGNRQE